MLRIAALLVALGGTLAAGPVAAQSTFRRRAAASAGRCSQRRVPGSSRRRCRFPGQNPRPAFPAPRSPSGIQSAALAAAARRDDRPATPPPARRHRRRRLQRARVTPQPANPPPPAAGRHRTAAGRHDHHRNADAKDRKRAGGLLRPRQDHRPHHRLRCRDRRDGAVRRAAGDAAGVLHAPADRADEHRRLCRSRRGDAAGRDQAHLHRLDVRRKPGPARGRASDLRRLADRLRVAAATPVAAAGLPPRLPLPPHGNTHPPGQPRGARPRRVNASRHRQPPRPPSAPRRRPAEPR